MRTCVPLLSFLLGGTDVFGTLLLSGASCFTPLMSTLPRLVGVGGGASDFRRPVCLRFVLVLHFVQHMALDGSFFSSD